MSLSTHGPRMFWLPAVLAGLVVGCQTAGPLATTTDSSSEVVQASAAGPVPEVDNLHEASPIGVDDVDLDDEPDDRIVRDEEDADALSFLDPEKAINSLKAATGFGPDRKIAKQLLKEAHELYEAKRFADAAAKFKSAAGRWPDSTLEEEAMFFQGESLFFADDYPKAHDTFANLLKKYDNTRYLDKVVLREFEIGRYWERKHDASPHWPVTPNVTDSSRPLFDTFGNAVKAYETVALYDPTGPLADDSLMALGNAYFIRERYQDAVDYYDRLRNQHPNSPHQLEAHLLAMKAKQEIYQGPLYDKKALEEAGEIADRTLIQFGPQLGDERENIIKNRNRINAQLAESDWAIAQFYEGRRAYGAARFYYQQLVKDHPNTEIAQAAQARLDEIKDYPDKPPNHFKFLTDLFPSAK